MITSNPGTAATSLSSEKAPYFNVVTSAQICPRGQVPHTRGYRTPCTIPTGHNGPVMFLTVDTEGDTVTRQAAFDIGEEARTKECHHHAPQPGFTVLSYIRKNADIPKEMQEEIKKTVLWIEAMRSQKESQDTAITSDRLTLLAAESLNELIRRQGRGAALPVRVIATTAEEMGHLLNDDPERVPPLDLRSKRFTKVVPRHLFRYHAPKDTTTSPTYGLSSMTGLSSSVDFDKSFLARPDNPAAVSNVSQAALNAYLGDGEWAGIMEDAVRLGKSAWEENNPSIWSDKSTYVTHPSHRRVRGMQDAPSREGLIIASCQKTVDEASDASGRSDPSGGIGRSGLQLINQGSYNCNANDLIVDERNRCGFLREEILRAACPQEQKARSALSLIEAQICLEKATDLAAEDRAKERTESSENESLRTELSKLRRELANAEHQSNMERYTRGMLVRALDRDRRKH